MSYTREDLRHMVAQVIQDHVSEPFRNVVSGDPSRADRLIAALTEQTGMPRGGVIHCIKNLASQPKDNV